MQEIKDKLKEWNLSLGMVDYSILKQIKKKEDEKDPDETQD